MDVELIKEIKNENIVIRQAEIDLHNQTQILLTKILRILSKEEIDRVLSDFFISEDERIISVDVQKNYIHLYVYNSDYMQNYNVDIDDLTQEQQKNIIDKLVDNLS